MLFNYRLQGKLYTDFKRQYVSRQYQEVLEIKTTMKLPSLYRLLKTVNIFRLVILPGKAKNFFQLCIQSIRKEH